MSGDETALQVPAQAIPAPKSISPQAQTWLAAAARRIANAGSETAAPGGTAESVTDGATAAMAFLRPMASGFKGSSETIPLANGINLYRATPAERPGKLAQVAYFDIHGGGFITGGGEMCRLLATLRAMNYGVEVFSIDYRLLPEHPFPAALDDCIAAYREVLKHYDAGSIVVGGSSAGANLAAALILRARDEGLPLPAALLLLTPATDLTLAGDSHQTNRFLDMALYGGVDYLPGYAGGADLADPYISPLFGDFSKGWPPTFLSTGTRDLLLSDTVRMHSALRRAGVPADLYVVEAGSHGGFMGASAPEDADVMAECRRFTWSAWGIAG